MGIPVGAKNLFPSNIQGLPTWFKVRVHPQGYVANRDQIDLKLALNPETLISDFEDLKKRAQKSPDHRFYFLYNSQMLKTEQDLEQGTLPNLLTMGLPIKSWVDELKPSPKLKRYLSSLAGVGFLAGLVSLEEEICCEVLADQLFQKPKEIVELNRACFLRGFAEGSYQRNQLDFQLKAKRVDQNSDLELQWIVDGNSASALGLLHGGASVAAWYPITPSSSLVESFESYARENFSGQVAVLQAEDELASLAVVAGAGWAGARAFTATSGPGLSLMAETAGFMYFAEIPGVLWNVQRVGPSTGLPTRTLQGDVLSAAYLSHGDTKHVLLIPGTVEECFEFGILSLELADSLQTLVIVLSDLDLGMNLWMTRAFDFSPRALSRGKTLSAQQIEELGQFSRYADPDGDGISPRTIPGNPSPRAAYFTRGTGHDPKSGYSERPEVYEALMKKLERKWETAKTLTPKPIVNQKAGVKRTLLAYGSTRQILPELLHELKSKGLGEFNTCEIKGFPFCTNTTESFLSQQELIFVIEQNRDAQMRTLILAECGERISTKSLVPVLSFRGESISVDHVLEQIEEGVRHYGV